MPPSALEEALFRIIRCYHQYAAREGDVETLSLEELKALLMDNVPHFMDSLHPRSSALRAPALGRAGSPRAQDSVFPLMLHFPQGRKEPYYLSELFRAADKNKDKQICFDEFLFILGRLLTDYHLLYHRQQCACYCARHSLY